MSRIIILLLLSLPLLGENNSVLNWYSTPSKTGSGSLTNCRPRLTRKLHVNRFFLETQSPMQATQTRLFYNLLNVLYGRQPIFHINSTNPINKSKLENLFDQVKKSVLKASPKYSFRKISDLANIDLENQDQQFIFFQLLKGGCGQFIRGGCCTLPPLLNYLSIKKRQSCLDVYTASKSVLFALFGSDAVVNDILFHRAELEKSDRTDTQSAEAEFRQKFEQYILPQINPCFVSFRVPPSMSIPKEANRDSDEPVARHAMSRDYWNEESYHCCPLHFDDAVEIANEGEENDESEFISQDLTIQQELLSKIPAMGQPCDDCGAPSIYIGYLDRDSRKHIDHLERELRYTQAHPECTCLWPELSEEASQISEEAYGLYKHLVTSSPLADMLSDSEEQKRFLKVDKGDLNAHGVAVSLIALQFRFSDFYELKEELCKYALEMFGKRQIGRYFKIKSELDAILASLYTRYLDLYSNCLTKHPTPEIEQEILFMYLLAGNGSALDSPSSEASTPMRKGRPATYHVLKHKHNKQKAVIAKSKRKDAFSLQARILLEKGTLLNDLLRYEESVKILSDSIRLDPSNRNGYIERAYAYLETDQISLALEDYKKIKALNIIPPFVFPAYQKGAVVAKGAAFWYTEEELEFLSGIIDGIVSKADERVEELPSSLRDSFTDVSNGLWAYVTDPEEVAREFTLAAYALGKYCYQHYDDDWIQYSSDLLRELAESWTDLGNYERGEYLGSIIGEFGIDFFASAGTLKGVQYFRDLKRANTVLTLERLSSSKANEIKILEQTSKAATARRKLIDVAKSGKIIGRSINQRHHIMQSHHAWERLVNLTGNEEKDFKAVVKFLEENGIFSKEFELETRVVNSTRIKIYRKKIGSETVRLEFIKNPSSDVFLLNNGWVETK